MTALQTVHVEALVPERLEELIGPDRAHQFETTAAAAREFLAGRRVLNLNSTASGGGVAELLQTLLAYARGVGIDTSWMVISCGAGFFTITKRVHNLLYGAPGDGGPLGDAERAAYESQLRDNGDELLSVVDPDDIVLLHDPQTAGLAQRLRSTGASIVWRCHVGRDEPNDYTERGWDFLRPYLEDAVDAYVFTRADFAPSWVPPDRLHVIPPSIDPFSTKNMELDPTEVRGILQYVGLVAGEVEPNAATFRHRDGSPGRVDRAVDILQTGPPPPDDVPLVVQASRWDPMKDMVGVMDAFARYVDGGSDAHLALVGPAVHGVADDPEAGQVLQECIARWSALPHAARARVHLACVPMHDPDEAAVIVNALQRHATVVAQKSIAEGFGLTVAEAMWKHRPVVASRVGGIVDQITDGETGVLIDRPDDLAAFGAAVENLLADPGRAHALGEAAHRRAKDEFLGDRHLERYADLFATLDQPRAAR
jgi:trehalose synthase